VKTGIKRSVLASLAFCLALAAYHTASTLPAGADASKALNFGPEQLLGNANKNPGAPFLRFAPDGRLFAVWTEADDRAAPPTNTAHQHEQHESTMRRMASRMRIAVLAWSGDGGKSWSPAKQVNTSIEAVQADENGPKVAFKYGQKSVRGLVDTWRERRYHARQHPLCDGRWERRLHTGANVERG
jgi:hypothetical protein